MESYISILDGKNEEEDRKKKRDVNMSIARAQCCFLFVDVLKMPKLEEEMAATAC